MGTLSCYTAADTVIVWIDVGRMREYNVIAWGKQSNTVVEETQSSRASDTFRSFLFCALADSSHVIPSLPRFRFFLVAFLFVFGSPLG